MENLHRIIAAYQKMDKKARKKYLVRMEETAKLYPDEKHKQPALKLVVNKNR